MSTPVRTEPQKLVLAATYRHKEFFIKAMELTERKYGEIDYVGGEFDFTFTEYYSDEMGEGLKKRMISLKNLIEPDKLVSVKKFSFEAEKNFIDEHSRRRINIDPGLLSRNNLVLSTFKNSPHRIYLGEGVYAEIELIYRNGGFAPLQWTYPDYAAHHLMDTFSIIRLIYLNQLKKLDGVK
ncbi:MAG TPA: DUF4416 family protein [bacterium]